MSFTREDAARRATHAELAAKNTESAMPGRMAAVASSATPEDRAAAEGHLELTRRQIQFWRDMSAAYERIARGEAP